MSRLFARLTPLIKDLPIWLSALLFAVSGIGLSGTGAAMWLEELNWQTARTTTGRVMLTEQKQAKGEKRLMTLYGYKDEHGVIYHNTGQISCKLGKINLEPRAPVVVFYRPEDHARSRLKLEFASNDWIAPAIIGACQILASALLVTVALRRINGRLSSKGARQAADIKNTGGIQIPPGIN